jgi:hypothetical protein
LLFDGSPLLPSSVYAQTDGAVLVGRDAVHAARVDPSRFEASPKRRIDDGTVLLGDREVTVPALIGAVLTHVAQEAVRVAGGPVSAVTLTHPAAWGVSRRLALVEGAKLAGLPQPALMPEPVAAAHYFAGVLQKPLAADQGLLVYDFGGGTFDASVVTRSAEGFDVRAVDGIDDLGGLDLDALIVDHAKQQLADPEVWARLESPQTTEDRRHRRLLWDDARIAKEMLSRTAATGLHVPIAAADVNITREAFEEKARPLLEQTVRTTSAVLRWAGLDKSRLAGLFLVGGSSRIPLVATLLERELGVAPTIIEQPELVVAEGSLRAWVGGGAAVAQGAQPVSGVPGNAGPGQAAPTAAAGAAAAGMAAGLGTTAATAATAAVQGAQQGFQQGPPAPAGYGTPGAGAPPVSGAPAGYAPQSAPPGGPQSGQQNPQGYQQGQPYQAPQAPQGYQQHTPPGGAAPVSGVPMSAVPMSGAPMSGAPVSPAAYQQGPVSPVSPAAYQQAQPNYQQGQPNYQQGPVGPGAYPASGPPRGTDAEATQPLRPSAPAYVSPALSPAVYAPPSREDPPPPARARRSVAVPLLVGVLVLALALAGYVVFRDRDRGGTNNAGQNGVSATGTASTTASPLPSHSPHVINPNYVKESRPWWVPQGWKDQNLGGIDTLWNTRDESEGGRCEATEKKLHVTTDPRGLTGCTLKGQLDKSMRDGAIEAKVHVKTGCAGMWLRTGDKGYMLGICADGYLRIYKLGNKAPGPDNTIGEWTYKATTDPYVAFRCEGSTLIFYVGGAQFGPVTDDEILSGKIDLGAFTSGDAADAEFSEVRVFLPPTNAGGGNPTGTATRSTNGSGSPSTSPSPKKSTTSAQPTA